MLKPSGGFLKKVFSPGSAFKSFKSNKMEKQKASSSSGKIFGGSKSQPATRKSTDKPTPRFGKRMAMERQ